MEARGSHCWGSLESPLNFEALGDVSNVWKKPNQKGGTWVSFFCANPPFWQIFPVFCLGQTNTPKSWLWKPTKNWQQHFIPMGLVPKNTRRVFSYYVIHPDLALLQSSSLDECDVPTGLKKKQLLVQKAWKQWCWTGAIKRSVHRDTELYLILLYFYIPHMCVYIYK